MSHYKTEFEDKDELNAQADEAIRDYSELVKIKNMFASLTVRAGMIANKINNPDVKHDVVVALEEIEANLETIAEQADDAREASTEVWEEPYDLHKEEGYTKQNTGCV